MVDAPNTPLHQSARLGSHRVSLPLGDKNLESLLLWRDPRKSGIVLTSFTIAYLILEWSNLSLLRIVSHTALAAVAVSFLWSNLARATNRPGLPLPAVIRQGVSEAQLRSFAQDFSGPINKLLGFAKRLATGQEPFLSVQVALVLYILGKVGNWFSSLALVYLVVLLAFSVPKLYELKKPEVDNVVSSVQKQTQGYYNEYAKPIVNKIPRASTSTANTGSVTAGNHANNNDTADSFTHIKAPNFETAVPEPKKTY